MQGVLNVPDDLLPLSDALVAALADAQRVFDGQLHVDLPPVMQLVRHVEHYRGKMLRPTLVALCGMAAHPKAGGTSAAAAGTLVGTTHATLGAVLEMVHMATLVHDDVLDDADVRRRGATVNRLYGNEAAVILGDYLIASAYHLCSTLPPSSTAGHLASLAVGRASMLTCQGELLQLHHRNDLSLDEATYYEIITRKTADLIACACELGARGSGATDAVAADLAAYGRHVGIAFQIQDDLLDLTGSEHVVGKSVQRDASKGKLTLPVIHHLANASAMERGKTLLLLESLGGAGSGVGSGSGVAGSSHGALREAVERTDSIAHAHEAAREHVARAKRSLERAVAESPARRLLQLMADAVVERSF
jgi:octaprenyl-diphosphate synthase